ncbi:hypothetical protein [Methyloversatilis sp.]|uniref:hypothetical protein n=1 Tax=Methyloversatilis sp. TaxID=2569862 RepID=UPI0027B92520|nr:hypothetical protein [Methyloversatilis sp.]
MGDAFGAGQVFLDRHDLRGGGSWREAIDNAIGKRPRAAADHASLLRRTPRRWSPQNRGYGRSGTRRNPVGDRCRRDPDAAARRWHAYAGCRQPARALAYRYRLARIAAAHGRLVGPRSAAHRR